MKYDSIVLGFGKGGKTLAGALAKKGERVALVERSSAMYGGTCINVGCIPSKSLIHSAALTPDGDFAQKAAHYKKSVEKKRRLTADLRQKNYNKLANAGVEILDGEGAFTGEKEIAVTAVNGQVTHLSADKIFINTGSVPVIPPIPGAAANPRVFISETLMDLEELPPRLTIVGGGYIGMEFAFLFASFGSRVTVVQDSDVFLPREDRDVAQAILGALETAGVTFVPGVRVLAIEGADLSCEVGGQARRIAGDAVLLATGRKPNTAPLHAEKANLALTPRGAVQVDEHLRTSVPGIWAMGDVCGGLQFTYISLDDSRIVLSDLFGAGERTTQNRGAVPYSVFLKPAFSRVGLSEAEADAAHLAYRVVRLPAAAIPKALVLGQPTGLLKALIEEGTGRILGAALFCEESYELINLVSFAMAQSVPYTALRDAIYTHPTMTEAFNDLFAQ